MDIKKVAFFVEGYTEQEFLKNLLVEIFGKKNIGVEIKNARGGSKTAIKYTLIESAEVNENTQYFVLIYNCGGDSAIKSYILDQRSSLIKSGYVKVIGFRDVFPDFTRQEIPKLVRGLNYKIPQKDLPISFVLSVMEIEGWFLAEENHYSEIDDSLNPDLVNNNFGFDPSSDNTENIDEPANKLKDIYNHVGKTYKKEKPIIDRTVNALDYGNLYLNVNNRIPSFKSLMDEIELIFVA
ncbi:DUF4276 family protein [Gramella lutea]|uniref:DUF4276 family protein n=1 Tax=Christiangramia lutea TaxID=1607951 RepID=A0A9X2AAC7_9FLAO|nr:DUF4276 family protein [Christiangramia lutea]MCH4824589.1 DUF4276 family protein [Christiangramia lutea]